MVGQLKVGGILAQLAPGGQIVIGLGLNVDQTKAELPPGAGALASLGADVDRNWLAIAVLAAVAGMYERWRRADTSLLSDIGQRMPILGCPIEARLPDGTVLVGTGRALAADGSLILLVDGREVLIQAADLSPVGNRQTRPLPEAAAGDEA
jgi:BirA family biotin operon repressor/biotin-[acetyl-CoA-carboxylase] ligase